MIKKFILTLSLIMIISTTIGTNLNASPFDKESFMDESCYTPPTNNTGFEFEPFKEISEKLKEVNTVNKTLFEIPEEINDISAAM